MNRKQQAQQLYMAGKTQKEIADMVGVSERTIYTWVHQFSWDKLRLAAFQAPATISDNLCSQLVEMQNVIAARPAGQRFPTIEEASVSRILINSIDKMKKYPSLSNHMQVLETFRNYIRPVNREFARQLASYTDRFLGAKAINGYAPYQVEYGVDPISPITAYYDEPSDEEDDFIKPLACQDIDNCLHPGDCNYPTCKRPDLYATPPDYNVPSFHFTPTPIPSFCDPEPAEGPTPDTTGSFPANPQSEPAENPHRTSTESAQSNSGGCSPSDITPKFLPEPAEGHAPEPTGSFPANPQSEPAKNPHPTSTESAQSNSEGCSPSARPTSTESTSHQRKVQPLSSGNVRNNRKFSRNSQTKTRRKPTSPSTESAQSNSNGCSPSHILCRRTLTTTP
jgi:hypothetical protein